MGILIQFTPQATPPPVASNESIVIAGNTSNNSVPVTVTELGVIVTPDSLAIATQALNGTASVVAGAIVYTPNAGFIGSDSFTYTAVSGSLTSLPAMVLVDVQTNYNCACDDAHPTQTLAQLRSYLMVRLGFGSQVANPPPGMAELLNSFLSDAQDELYRKYTVFRLERWFTWAMQPGVRFYDLAANAYQCTKKLDPRRVRWVGISYGDNGWRPLACGIDPMRYSSQISSIPDSYEIRQCIEVWPAPSSSTWLLRIKGDFGLLPFAVDTDVTTIDPDPIKLLALANAKAHYGQPDAGNYMGQVMAMTGDLTAGSHNTRRYIPGEDLAPPAVMPKMV